MDLGRTDKTTALPGVPLAIVRLQGRGDVVGSFEKHKEPSQEVPHIAPSRVVSSLAKPDSPNRSHVCILSPRLH